MDKVKYRLTVVTIHGEAYVTEFSGHLAERCADAAFKEEKGRAKNVLVRLVHLDMNDGMSWASGRAVHYAERDSSLPETVS